MTAIEKGVLVVLVTLLAAVVAYAAICMFVSAVRGDDP